MPLLMESTQQLLRCPICKSNLVLADSQFKCTNVHCGAFFPIVNGVPVLINESSSLFSIDEVVNNKNTIFRPSSKMPRFATRLVPTIDCNIKAKKNYEKLTELLLRENANPQVLVVGGVTVGRGMQVLLSVPSIECIESDVAFGPRTALICDAHDIPFESYSLDGVIVQAVLEHVVDPYRCVHEIHRVLKDRGLVYAETPFMQQVHSNNYDFTRFTHLGHRRLFRNFEEISSGAVAGPGSALAWSYAYLLRGFASLFPGFAKSKAAITFLRAFVRFTAFWLKYFDYYLIDKPNTFDAAPCYFFMGRKSNKVLSDRELIELYRGLPGVYP